MKPCRSASKASRTPAAAAVGPGDDLEEMPVRILEIEAAAAVVAIDLSRLRLPGIGPVGKLPVADPTEYPVEFGFADQEGVVLWRHFALGIHVVEICDLLGGAHVKRPPPPRGRGVEPLPRDCRRRPGATQ